MAQKRTTAATAAQETPAPAAWWAVPTWLAWAAVAAAVLLTAAIAWQTKGPAFFNDEISTMVAADKIAHPGHEWQLGGKSYLPGSSIVVAPLWWFITDQLVAYRAAIGLLAAVSVATIWPLTRLAQLLGAPRNLAMVLASVVVVAPGHVMFVNYAWGEQLLGFTMAAALWRGLVLSREATARNAVLFGVAAASAYLAHGRAFVFVGVCGIALLVLAVRRWKIGLPGAVAYAALVAAGHGLYLWISSSIYVGDDRTASVVETLVDQSPGRLASAVSSQLWYLTVTWAGLLALGGAYLVREARRGNDTVFARWSLGAVAATMVFIVLNLSGARGLTYRLDLHVYGRYSEGLLFPLALLGLIYVIRGFRARVALTTGVAALVGSIGVLAFTVASIPKGGIWWAGHIPGIAHLLSLNIVGREASEPWAAIVFLMVFVLALFLALTRRPKVFVAAAALYFVGVAAATDVVDVNQLEGPPRSPPIAVAILRDVDPANALAIDRSQLALISNYNTYLYAAYPRNVIPWDASADPRPADMVLGPLDFADALDAGALPLNGSYNGTYWIWVYPGDLFDELNAQGRLAPKVEAPDDDAGEDG